MPVPTYRLLWLRVPEFPGLQTFLGWGDFSAKTRKDQEKARQVGHLAIDTVPEVLRGWMISQPCHLVVKLTHFQQCQSFFSQGSSGLKANIMLTQIIWKWMKLPKQSGLKLTAPLGIYLNYSPMLRNNSVCQSTVSPILTIHATSFPSSLSEEGN